MNRREQITIYIQTKSKTFILCRIINIGTNNEPHFKITDTVKYGVITQEFAQNGKSKVLNPSKQHIEMTYHYDGSPLYKINLKENGETVEWHLNFRHRDYKQTPIYDCANILPLINIQIRRLDLYQSVNIESESSKKKVYICTNDELFCNDLLNDNQSILVIIYLKSKKIPLTRIATSSFISDVLASINPTLDLCIYICRRTFNKSLPYYDNELSEWITPTITNSVSFCDQPSIKEILVQGLSLIHYLYSNYYIALSDGGIYHLTKEKLLVIDCISNFYKQLEDNRISKYQFTRFVFEILGDKINSFLSLPSTNQHIILQSIWNGAIKESKSRNWFK